MEEPRKTRFWEEMWRKKEFWFRYVKTEWPIRHQSSMLWRWWSSPRGNERASNVALEVFNIWMSFKATGWDKVILEENTGTKGERPPLAGFWTLSSGKGQESVKKEPSAEITGLCLIKVYSVQHFYRKSEMKTKNC